MEWILELKLERSDVISLLALLVAGLSACYARWTWAEAKKANQISLLGHKQKIYDAFLELKNHMNQKSLFAESSEVSKFQHHTVNAGIYLPQNIATDIKNYFNACFWLANIHENNGGITKDSGIECKPHIETERVLAPKVEKSLLKLLQIAQY